MDDSHVLKNFEIQYSFQVRLNIGLALIQITIWQFIVFFTKFGIQSEY